jgi:hypothetical protein
VIAGTATSVSNRVSRRQAERWQAQEAQQAPQQPVAAAPPPPAPTSPAAGSEQSTIEQLKELAALKEQGVLTEEEFAAQKAKILG